MTKNPILSWINLTVGYHRQKALIFPFSGSIDTPGIYAILGQNGCGKSTLLKTWLGLIAPLQGKIKFNREILNCKDNILGGIAYVPQFHNVNKYFQITVLDFIKQGFGPRHRSTDKDLLLISEYLDSWQLAGHLRNSFHDLSGGQKVRCMLIRAILSKPKLIFLDEPLASLDSCCRQQLMDTLQNLVLQQDVSILMIDHHLEHYEKYINSKFCFYKGHDAPLSTIQHSFSATS